jgi:hypothetical protein
MRRFGYSKALCVFTHSLCLVWMAQVGAVLFGTALKLAAILLFALLLLFVVGRSAAIVKALCGCLPAQASLLGSPAAHWQRDWRPQDSAVHLCEPTLSSPFQRPPPLPAV